MDPRGPQVPPVMPPELPVPRRDCAASAARTARSRNLDPRSRASLANYSHKCPARDRRPPRSRRRDEARLDDWRSDRVGDSLQLAAGRAAVSAGFDHAVQQIKTRSAKTGICKVPRIGVSIETDFSCGDTDALTALVHDIRKLEVSLQQLIPPGGVCITVERVCGLFSAAPLLGPAGLRILTDMASLGIRVDDFPVLDSDCAHIEYAGELIDAVRSIFLPPPNAIAAVDTVWVAENSTNRSLAAVLSAVRHSSTVRSLIIRWQDGLDDLNDDEDDEHGWIHEQKTWKTITQSLFSRYAQHRIETL